MRDHQKRLLERAECEIEEEKDDADDNRNDQEQSARGALLILELAAIGDRVSRRQTDFPADSSLNLTHKAAEIPSTHVRHDYHTPLAFFAIDYLGGAGDAYVSNLADGHLFSLRSM